MHNTFTRLLLALVLALPIGACAEGEEEGALEGEEDTLRIGEELREATRAVGNEVGEGMQKAGEAVRGAADETGQAVGEAMEKTGEAIEKAGAKVEREAEGDRVDEADEPERP